MHWTPPVAARPHATPISTSTPSHDPVVLDCSSCFGNILCLTIWICLWSAIFRPSGDPGPKIVRRTVGTVLPYRPNPRCGICCGVRPKGTERWVGSRKGRRWQRIWRLLAALICSCFFFWWIQSPAKWTILTTPMRRMDTMNRFTIFYMVNLRIISYYHLSLTHSSWSCRQRDADMGVLSRLRNTIIL